MLIFTSELFSFSVHITPKKTSALEAEFVDEAIKQAKVDSVTGSGFVPLSQQGEEVVKPLLHKIVERLRVRSY